MGGIITLKLHDPQAIPRAASPESAGISSEHLARIVGDILGEGLELHSIMVVRRGEVAYEDFRAPYGPDDPHTMFSVSKSITSIALGFAVDEGLVSLDDKVADRVPELLKSPHENWDTLRVADLIRMSGGKRPSILVDKRKKQWVRDYAKAAWAYAPGEGFNYCNENIYMLCVIISRAAGMSVTDFLMPRLFEPLGIARPFWETDGRGVEAGGWGIFLKTEDLAKIGLCYLNEGKYRGRQVIPARWVAESGRDQSAPAKDVSEGWNHGYGYGFWMNRAPGGCRMDGMFAQFLFILPDYDACIATTAGELHMGKIIDAIFRHLPALFDEQGASCEVPKLPPYPPLPAAQRNPALEARLNRSCIRFVPTAQPLGKAVGFPLSMLPAMILFMAADKAGGVNRVHLRFEEENLKFSWSEGKERNTVLCGLDGRDRKCKITLGGMEFIMACSAAWEGDTLQVRLRCLSSVAQRLLTFRFHGRMVRMLPRSLPGLENMTASAADAVRDGLGSKALGSLVAGVMDRITALAEPEHVGYMG